MFKLLLNLTDEEAEAVVGLIRLKYSDMENITSYSNKFKKTKFQVAVLEKIFDECPCPNTFISKDIALLLRMDVRIIQVWFQNKRCKLRKQRKKLIREYKDKGLKYPEKLEHIEFSGHTIKVKRIAELMHELHKKFTVLY